MDLSIVIPTYNGAERLPAVLDSLKSQRGVENIAWEVIVADNNSHDATAEVVKKYQANWLDNVPLRYLLEPQQGPAYARHRGVKEAEGEFVGFLDDDNWPAEDWAMQVVEFGRAYPRAGVYGGIVEGVFESPPPDKFEAVQHFLVIRNYGNEAKLFEPEKLKLPAGAGFVARREAWLQSIPEQPARVVRGGDDYEVSLRIYYRGWEIWYCPKMKIKHFIPTQRMEQAYLVSLARLYGLCTCDVLLPHMTRKKRFLVMGRVFLGSTKRLVKVSLAYRPKAFNQLDYACEFSFHLGSTLSPLFYIGRRFKPTHGLTSRFEV